MGKRAFLLALAGYSALTLLMTWPLILHLASALPHDAEDPLLSATILWWNARVLPLTQRWIDGFFFYPVGGALTLSDHRLGLSPIASPLLWLGLDPITVYNVTFLATYPLCAIGAHALAFSLTRRHDASLVCALAYAFNPFRVEHLPHLELLAAFGMPIALLTLHRYIDTRRPVWMVALAAALLVQGLACSYYLLFFQVFVGLWVVWFVRWRDWRTIAWFAAACLACGIVLAPIAVAYLRVHQAFGLSRNLREVVLYSADATSIVTAPGLIALWGWTSPINGGEARTFPGMTIMIVVTLGMLDALRRPTRARPTVLPKLLLGLASAFAAVALITAVRDGWMIHVGPIVVSSRVAYKPLSVAAAALAFSIALSARARAAFRVQSLFAFYVLAAGVLYLCSMGPEPAFLGHRILYQPPYAWLMHLPLFDYGVRAPARFAMLVALALSVAAALAFSRLSNPGAPRTRIALAVVVVGILADTWVPGIPLAAAPVGWRATLAQPFTAAIELPLGATADDVAAMYHATQHHLPTINGYSGYSPPHYDALRIALSHHDETAMDALAAYGPLLVAANRTKNGDWPAFVRGLQGATTLGEDGPWVLFSLARQAPVPPPCETSALPIAAAHDARGAVSIAKITDGDKLTVWTSEHSQKVGDTFVVDLGQPAAPCAVLMWQDGFTPSFPPTLSVATSIDGAAWTTAFVGKTGGPAIRGAIAAPLHPPLAIALPSAPARFIKLRIEQALEPDWWVITDLAVRGEPLASARR